MIDDLPNRFREEISPYLAEGEHVRPTGVAVNSADIPIDGRYYQEGSGNTAGTIGAVIGAGIVGGLIVHGHSAEVPEGKEFNVATLEAVPFDLADANGPAVLAADYKPAPVSLQVETEKERKARIKQQENATKG